MGKLFSNPVLEVADAIGLDPAGGLQVMRAADLPGRSPSPALWLIVVDLSGSDQAARVRDALRPFYPPEQPVTVAWPAGGVPGFSRVTRPLGELGREWPADGTAALFVQPSVAPGAAAAFARFAGVVQRLRAPGGCPWDREQTHLTLRPYVVEEAYEVVEAIESGESARLVDELGDLLLQVLLHSTIAREAGTFDAEAVAGAAAGKIIRRHPHVFGGATADTVQAVRAGWEAIKRSEKAVRGEEPESLFAEDGPRSLPALMEAEDLQSRAAGVGFDWPSAREAWIKVEEESAEFRRAWEQADASGMEEELGDLLFAVINVARLLKLDPEVALKGCNRKFVRRFREMERLARGTGLSLAGMALAELDALWEEAKLVEKAKKR